jgi:multiple sugar transport system ATP-binding protein
MTTDGIMLRDVVKEFDGGTRAVDHVNLDVHKGEFMVFVGPSGCGKTTLLRMVAGLEQTSEGSIVIDGRDVTHAHPKERDISMVFQNYALYPHMTVEDNLGFGLRIRKMPKARRRELVHETARTLGLEELLGRKPSALSGGQRQRVAIGRAMVRHPAAFLMDEPLSNLDAKLRVSMRAALARLHEQLGVTTVYVTHDQVEAMTLGQRVVVLRDGRVQQVDTPQNLFKSPVNLFVAAFIGSPSMNLVEAQIEDDAVRFGSYALPIPAGTTLPRGRVVAGIRPTDFENAATADPALPRMTVRPRIVQDLGAETQLFFTVDAPRHTGDAIEAANDGDDAEQKLFGDGDGAEFTAQVDSRTSIAVGRDTVLAVHAEAMHFFDPRTGEALGRSGARDAGEVPTALATPPR